VTRTRAECPRNYGIMVQFLEGAVDFEAHPTADSWGTRGCFRGGYVAWA